jgi:periplasmic protein TonB
MMNHVKVAILFLTAVVSLHAQEILHSTQPALIHKAEPQYTEEARDAKLEGAVELSSTIGTDGVPSDIKVLRELGMGLDEKAVECLRQWRFKPATSHTEPVATKATVQINFRLLESPK